MTFESSERLKICLRKFIFSNFQFFVEFCWQYYLHYFSIIYFLKMVYTIDRFIDVGWLANEKYFYI